MKDKPISHKNQNTFHFLTFAERLNNINIDVIRRVQKVHETAEDANTFFQEAIEKWDDLNYTEDYAALVKEIGPEVRTLSQIVLRLDDIAEILLRHLQKPENLALDAILELVVALSKDLQKDFYDPYFPKFFVAITQWLRTKDTDVLEKIFTCLSYLFKFLWRYMVKDMENVYRLFSTLLNNTNKMYIRNFAAESFAFLMRKVPNKIALFNFIFRMLMDNPEQAEGVGQLLFETVKGVKQRFHTCTEELFQLLLSYLGQGLKADREQPLHLQWSLVEQALLQMLKSVAKHTSKENGILVQNILCNTTSQLLRNLQAREIAKDLVVQHLSNVLQLFMFWVKYHDGVLVMTDKNTIKVLSDLSQATGLPESCYEHIVEIIVSFFLSAYIQMPFECISGIISSIYTYPSKELVFHFTRRMFSYGLFEKDVLPCLLEYCVASLKTPSSVDEEDVLEIMAELVTNLRPPVNYGEDIKRFSTLNISSNFWATRILDADSEAEHIENVIRSLHSQLSESSTSSSACGNVESLTFVLSQAVTSWILLDLERNTHKDFPYQFFVDLIIKYPESVNILQMASFFLYYSVHFRKTVVPEDIFVAIFPHLLANLASPFHKVRIFTLQILCAFDLPLPQLEDDIVADQSLFSICLEAEQIPVSIQDYREKLKLLQRLEYPSVKKYIPTVLSDQCLKAPIYYLLGTLYINFRLLWQPAQNLLESFARGVSRPFWEVFNPYLQNIISSAEMICKGEDDCLYSSTKCNEDQLGKVTLFQKTMFLQCKHSEIPDILNHRELLWKAMGSFPDVVEPRNKDVVPLLFRFIKNEIAEADDTLISSETVNREDGHDTLDKKNKDVDMCDDELECSDSEANIAESIESMETSNSKVNLSENEDMQHNSNETDDFGEHCEVSSSKISTRCDASFLESKESRIKRKKCLTKALSAYLTLFTKFKNPKAFHRTEELQILYYELLSHHDGGIQKLAFDCIMTYNYKYLVPYKENFYNILDDKSFKTEVVLFSLDESNGIIEKEHRMKLMPVLMRILYGKMLRKTGNNTAGKAQAHTRRSIVLRFLAGCKAEELRLFLNLAFAPFKEQLEGGDALSIVKNIRTSIDISSIVPIRKQHSALNTLGTVLKHLGSLVPELLPWLLKVLLIITATSSVLLERRNEVLSHCVTRLKSIRTLAVDKLIQFFTSFNQYNFSKEEIDAIFEAIVWPMLPRLEFEALHQPPPLLRLLATWSENPRFFILFAKHHGSSKSLSPLPHLMALYTAAKAQPKVIAHISKMLNHLLTPPDSYFVEKESSSPELKINFHLPVTRPKKYASEDSISYGTLLLLPHINMILKRLRAIVTKVAKNPKSSLNSCDLNILLRISEYVEDPEQSSELIELLIPSLMKQKRLSEDAEGGVLSTINNLMRNVDDPIKFISYHRITSEDDSYELLKGLKHFPIKFNISLCPLFGLLSYQQSRVSLIEIFKTMSIKQQSLQSALDVISKINAWDPSHSEREIEPDYQLRLDGHALAVKAINNMTDDVDEDFIRIIIFNSSYVIRLCDDLSLRDSASYLLQQLTKKFFEFISHNSDSFKVIVMDTLMPEIQKGLKNKAEVVRHEFIKILASVLHNCGSHPRLQGLAVLCDKDEDMDFWQNISHVQVHRRSRALLRFSRSLSSGELSMHPHLLMTYITPIVTSILFDTAYKKHIDVVDAAVETTGAIAKTFPWSRYEPMLRYYLNLLPRLTEHNKTIVKVIVAILNAFHFDLSASRGIQSNLKEPPVKVAKVTSEVNDVVMNPSDECEPMEVCETNEVLKDDEKVAGNNNSIIDEEKATKIHYIIAKSILPQLHRSLTQKTRSDEEHKLAGQHHPEDEEILRVPIALAMVKLLQNLPHDSLKVNLPGLFLKMCNFLKSRAESIRETARETLIKMMQSLGPSYLWYLLREMKGVLKKGYQVHVMNYTVNAILSKLKDQLTDGDLDSCVESLTEVCNNELFGNLAEEKEVAQITRKLKEARGNRSHMLYQIVSLFISEDCVPKLIQPLKQILSDTHSHKTVKKVQDCLRHIAEGLSENKGVSAEYLLKFIQETISENITSLSNNRNSKPTEPTTGPAFVRPDIFVIPKEPPRGGIPAKTSMKTNAHVMIEFGLLLLHLYAKKERSTLSSEEHCEVLNRFIPDLADCLTCDYIKIISVTLRSLMWLFKFPLPSLKTTTESIVNSLFVLLNKYAGEGMGQGDNFEMVVMCFKMVTLLVKDTDYHQWTNEQLKVLLSYVEQDIYSYNRQATAFNLLKAVLSKKLQTPELTGIMSKVAEMSINSEQEHIRAQCRQASLQYLLDYPLGKKIQDKLVFFVTQLEYFHEGGRISAIEMINSILSTFPPEEVKKHVGLFLVPLAARLVNDEASKCRKMAAATIKSMLKKVDHDERSNLFSIAFTWLQNKKMSHRRLGAQLCGIFADVEGDKFERHLDDLLPVIEEQTKAAKSADIESYSDERCTDHFLYHLLNALCKIFTNCSVIRNRKHLENLHSIWETLQQLILYPHLWVRLATGQLFGLLFASFSIDEVLAAIPEESSEHGMIFFATRQKLRDLSADFATQLQSPYLNEELGEQVIRNLIYLAKIISRLPQIGSEQKNMDIAESVSDNEEDDAVTRQPVVTFDWMIRKLCREIKKEVSQSPHNTVKRKCVFKFLAAVALDLGEEKVTPILSTLLQPLCRELADSSPNLDPSVMKLAQEVIDLLRNIVDAEVFTSVYAEVHRALCRKKTKRKHDKAMEAATDSVAFARKKIKRQQSKKKAKKHMKGKNPKKSKMKKK